MSVIFGGCSIPNLILNNKTESHKYTLTARQKQILKQEGLPLDYEKLNDTQKSAIECIEDIFKYLDKTYPKENFEYSGYVPYSTLEPEHLIVESQYGEVTVNRYVSTDSPNDPPTFKDDFKDVKAADVYATVVDDYLAKKYDIDDYCVIAYVSIVPNRLNGTSLSAKFDALLSRDDFSFSESSIIFTIRSYLP